MSVPFKVDVTTQLLGPDPQVAGKYIKIQDGTSFTEEEIKNGKVPKYVTFKDVVFNALIQFKLEKDETETDKETFHRIYLAQRVHECKGLLELEESDRQILLTKVARAARNGRVPEWLMFDCWQLLEGKPQIGSPEVEEPVAPVAEMPLA